MPILTPVKRAYFHWREEYITKNPKSIYLLRSKEGDHGYPYQRELTDAEVAFEAGWNAHKLEKTKEA